MAYKKHPREITDQQFSTGTTIDGSRIDDAMSDAVDRFNDVPKSDIATRWTQTQYVMGFSKPNRINIGTQPFLPIKNDDAISVTPPDEFQNAWRIKACDMIDVQPGPTTSRMQYAWTVPLYFARPVIVDAIHVFLTKDNATDTTAPTAALIEYNGPFLYGATPPIGRSTGDNSEDLSIVMHVDSPFAPEERTQNDIEVVRNKFQINRENFTQIPWHAYATSTNAGGTAWTDMLPAQYPGGGPAGSAIILDDLNVPLHANARVRLAMVIPPLSTVFGVRTTSSWSSSAATWGAAYYTMVLTVLEEIV
jgi:hypothetical protein